MFCTPVGNLKQKLTKYFLRITVIILNFHVLTLPVDSVIIISLKIVCLLFKF